MCSLNRKIEVGVLLYVMGYVMGGRCPAGDLSSNVARLGRGGLS